MSCGTPSPRGPWSNAPPAGRLSPATSSPWRPTRGHADIADTYWYLEATPELLAEMATSTEALVAKEAA